MPFGQRGEESIHRFRAQYYGTCWACGNPIEPGDFIGYVDEEIHCPECCEEFSR